MHFDGLKCNTMQWQPISINADSIFQHTHTKKNWCNTWEGFFPILPGTLQSTDLAVQAMQGRYSLQLSALYRTYRTYIYIYKFNLYDLHVTPHNQTNTGISLCNFYKASPPQASTLHFSRHCKAEGKNHIQAKPVQGPARLQWELNPISCTAKLEESGSTTKLFAVPEKWASDPPVSPFNVLRTGTKSYRLEQCSYFVQMFLW